MSMFEKQKNDTILFPAEWNNMGVFSLKSAKKIKKENRK